MEDRLDINHFSSEVRRGQASLSTFSHASKTFIRGEVVTRFRIDDTHARKGHLVTFIAIRNVEYGFV